MLAGFLVLIWFIPFDATSAPVSLPVDSQVDRLVLAALALAWIVAALGARELGPRRIRSPLNIAVIAFLAVATISVLLNISTLARLDELDLAVKKLSLAGSLAVFFCIAATTIRRAELRPFISLTIVLAAIAAIGTIVEYRSGTNHFYALADALFPGFTVAPEPVDPTFGRPSISGPTSHGLALTVMFAMAVPFVIVRLTEAEKRRRLLYAVAAGLILAGGVATLRKTAVPAFGVGLLVLTVYRPRAMIRLLPLGLVLVLAIHLLAPGALSGLRYELTGGSEFSNQARISDYSAVEPDIAAHPILGRGFGTYDPRIHLRADTSQRHRILDNQYLVVLIETGIIGLLVYISLAVTAVGMLHRTARSADPARAGPAMAIIAGVAAFAVASTLFDTLAFAQVPYLFFFLLAIGVVARLEPDAIRLPRRSAAARAEA
ncbi:MAG TPA: O-antigen ligase family protein [Solirubrobacterales bacterium]|jgi:hypothetical protein|nr:O-antigen ligase family protein [Solirubrobacterales bacterium]